MTIQLPKQLGDLSGGSDLVPSGQYALRVIAAEIEGKAKGQILRLNYEVTSTGPYEGRQPFPEYFGLADDAIWKLVGLLKALGAPGETKLLDEKKLIGKLFICYVSQKEYEGNMRNRYASYIPFSEEAAKGIQAPPAQAVSAAGDFGPTVSGKTEVDMKGW